MRFSVWKTFNITGLEYYGGTAIELKPLIKCYHFLCCYARVQDLRQFLRKWVIWILNVGIEIQQTRIAIDGVQSLHIVHA